MGAMRCVGCGKILKTPEEQADSIKKLKESKKSFNIGRFFRLIILILVIAILYYFFSEQIIELINNILDK
jgi:hypothetical protein